MYLLIELLKIRPWKIYALLPFLFARILQSGRTLQEAKNWTIGRMISGMTENQIKRTLQKFSDRIQILLRQPLVDRIIEHASDNKIVITPVVIKEMNNMTLLISIFLYL